MDVDLGEMISDSRFIGMQLSVRGSKELREHGLTGIQAHVLLYILNHSEGTSLTEIHRETGYSMAATSGLIKRLRENGFVRVEPYKLDERRKLIFATEKTFQGIFAVNDLAWVEQHIVNNHGVWGAAYPPAGMGCPGICEGDTPSFLYLISALRGVSQAEDPTMESWGGQFRQLPGTKHYVDAGGGITVSKWAPDFQVDFLKKLELIAE